MPSNINSFINRELRSLKVQAEGKRSYRPKTGQLHQGGVDRVAKRNQRDYESVVSGGFGDAHALVAGFLYRQLSLYTPVDKGHLNGAWTAGESEINNSKGNLTRTNPTNHPRAGENNTILQTIIKNGNVDLRNANQIAKLINSGNSSSTAKAFVEQAIRDTKAYAKSLGLKVIG